MNEIRRLQMMPHGGVVPYSAAMAIDRTGPHPTGTNASDLDDFLREAMADGYPIGPVVHAECTACAATVFSLVFDGVEGYAERRCLSCHDEWVMLDCADYADEADPARAACLCGEQAFEIAAGFSPHPDGEVRWVTIAMRCVACAMLDVHLDWKIDYKPTAHLVTQV